MRWISLLLLLAGCTQQAPIVVQEAEAQDIDYSGMPVRCRAIVSYVLGAENPSREMAQTEQESGCNQFAESPFAKGYRQFTDATGEWLSTTHCKHLGPYRPFDEAWSMRCGLIYMQVLERDNNYGDYCANRIVGEQEYNGGRWVVWEIQKAGNLKKAENICGKVRLHNGRKRAGWACRENYDYPRHITKRQSKYRSIGGKLCA